MIDDHLILASTKYAIKHNINAADALHLEILLSLQKTLRQSDDELNCMTADKRLARAARTAGMTTVDPELHSLTQARALSE
jgi:hypothetical protein